MRDAALEAANLHGLPGLLGLPWASMGSLGFLGLPWAPWGSTRQEGKMRCKASVARVFRLWASVARGFRLWANQHGVSRELRDTNMMRQERCEIHT
mgnify:FL=1